MDKGHEGFVFSSGDSPRPPGSYPKDSTLDLASFLNYLSFAFPLAWKAMKIAHSNYANTQRLIPTMSTTVTTHLTVGLLLSSGYVTARILTWI